MREKKYDSNYTSINRIAICIKCYGNHSLRIQSIEGNMNRSQLLISLILLFYSCKTDSNSKSNKSMITLETLQEYYARMDSEGVNTDTIMLYGYFFTNDKTEPFNKVVEELKEKNFKFVEIYQGEDKIYWLHVERKEKHDANSLFQVNKELYAIADKYNLESYDGFDMGNVDNTKAIEKTKK